MQNNQAKENESDIEQLVDYKKISTAVAQRAIDRLLDATEAKVKQQWAKYKNYRAAEFSRYIQAQRKRCNLVRTLIYSAQSTNLEDICIPISVRVYSDAGSRIRHRDVTSEQLIELLIADRDSKRHRPSFAGAISGLAGAGKSFYMRKLYVDLCSREITKIPIFLEARELNTHPPLTFPEMVAKAFKVSGCNISLEQAQEGLKSGIFCILLDGIDEIKISLEKHYAVELDRAAETFSHCPLLTSGRPSPFLLSSNYFDNCELLPLTMNKAINLIERLNFDDGMKSTFKRLITEELWTTHQEFLEIPLLAVVMLITYSDAGRISSKQHEFYEDAYNALWRKHDARKQAGFEREKYTGLDRNEFLKLASAFSASSYMSEHFSMRDGDFSNHVHAARQLTDISVDDDNFFKDMTVSTSLMIIDGNRYKFSHRSFQEYLCANYVLELGDEDIARGIEAVSSRYETDSVLAFIKSINPERFETAWVLPNLMRLRGALESATESHPNYVSLVSGEDGPFLMKVREVYGLNPTNDKILAATDARAHIGAAGKGAPQVQRRLAKLFLRDLANLTSLLGEMEKRCQTRSQALSSLFRTN